jgi:hypothetical protein
MQKIVTNPANELDAEQPQCSDRRPFNTRFSLSQFCVIIPSPELPGQPFHMHITQELGFPATSVLPGGRPRPVQVVRTLSNRRSCSVRRPPCPRSLTLSAERKAKLKLIRVELDQIDLITTRCEPALTACTHDLVERGKVFSGLKATPGADNRKRSHYLSEYESRRTRMSESSPLLWTEQQTSLPRFLAPHFQDDVIQAEPLREAAHRHRNVFCSPLNAGSCERCRGGCLGG